MALSIDRLGWAGGEIRRTQCALLEGANCPWQEPSYLEDAIQAAIARASSTLDNIRWFEVTETRGHVEGGKVAYYQVTLKVGFTLKG